MKVPSTFLMKHLRLFKRMCQAHSSYLRIMFFVEWHLIIIKLGCFKYKYTIVEPQNSEPFYDKTILHATFNQ